MALFPQTEHKMHLGKRSMELQIHLISVFVGQGKVDFPSYLLRSSLCAMMGNHISCPFGDRIAFCPTLHQ